MAVGLHTPSLEFSSGCHCFPRSTVCAPDCSSGRLRGSSGLPWYTTCPRPGQLLYQASNGVSEGFWSVVRILYTPCAHCCTIAIYHIGTV